MLFLSDNAERKKNASEMKQRKKYGKLRTQVLKIDSNISFPLLGTFYSFFLSKSILNHILFCLIISDILAIANGSRLLPPIKTPSTLAILAIESKLFSFKLPPYRQVEICD